MTASEASEQYTIRRDRWAREKAADDRRSQMVSNWRGLTALTTLVLAYFVFAKSSLSLALLSLPVLGFAGLVAAHSRINGRRTNAQRALAYYQRALERMAGRWMGKGQTGERHLPSDHIYAADLDLFGRGSLFDLLAGTRTTAGENTLANWLLAPGEYTEVLERQDAVRDMVDRLQLREDIALAGADIQSEVDEAALRRWSKAPPIMFASWLRPATALLGLLAIVGLIATFARLVPPVVFVIVLAVNIVVRYMLRQKVRAVLSASEDAGSGLHVVAAALDRFGREPFAAPKLLRLQADLRADSGAASRIRHLQRLFDWRDSADHFLLRILQPVLLFNEQVAMAIERWRVSYGPAFARWLAAVAELEAMSSLAALAYEHPQWCFPALQPSGAVCHGKDLRHPLLPPNSAVPNDVRLEDPTRVFIVSGSNMSGKSTWLRCVGLNCVLAWAGGPVAASSLVISRFQLAACIRINDSVLDGKSRFYAEILRIRDAMKLTNEPSPVLFLLDEILSGTNSSDRRVGAEAILRKFAAANARGLVTTHDLALTEIDLGLLDALVNVHFEDFVTNGQLGFDYRIKAGVVRRGNALALIRAAGIEL